MQRLIYTSTVSILDGLFEFELSRILHVARTRNRSKNITGCLLFSDRYFVQLLEGERARVSKLYSQIAADTRHRDVELVEVQPIETRDFADWDMASLGLHDMPPAFLRHYASGDMLDPYKMDPRQLRDMILSIDRNMLNVA